MERIDRKLLSLAERRNGLIPDLLATDSVYISPTPKKTDQVRVIANFFIREFRITGIEHLLRGVQLSQTNRLIVTSNHQTDLDHAAKRHIFEALGFQEFADRLVYPAGLKMKERWWTNYFIGAEHTVFIATPTDLEAGRKILLKDKRNHFLTGSQRSTFVSYEENLRHLNHTAMGRLWDLRGQGLVTALYPEAARSRHPKSLIQRAPKSVAFYTLPREGEPEAYVLPMSVGGLEQVLPPNKLMRFWRKAKLKVVFGQPYPVFEIWDPRKVEALKKMGAEKSDYLVAKIAVLNPDLVERQDLEFYQRVLDCSD